MSPATIELDFFAMDKDNRKSQFQKFLHRRRSFRGVQGALSKIDPEIIKSVIGSGAVNQSYDKGHVFDCSTKPLSVPSTPREDIREIPLFPVHASTSRSTAEEEVHETAPLTIFYNGKVLVFDLTKNKAESILNFAAEACPKNTESIAATIFPSSGEHELLDTLNGDFPIARKKSLQRFLEKRKERLTNVCPY